MRRASNKALGLMIDMRRLLVGLLLLASGCSSTPSQPQTPIEVLLLPREGFAVDRKRVTPEELRQIVQRDSRKIAMVPCVGFTGEQMQYLVGLIDYSRLTSTNVTAVYCEKTP